MFWFVFSPETNAQSVEQTSSTVIYIKNLSFQPTKIEVPVGTTVTWINDDLPMHTVTQGEPGTARGSRAFDSGLLAQGDEWSFTFTEAGTYQYYCIPHPFMRGTVIVKDAHGQNAPQATPTPHN